MMSIEESVTISSQIRRVLRGLVVTVATVRYLLVGEFSVHTQHLLSKYGYLIRVGLVKATEGEDWTFDIPYPSAGEPLTG